MSSTPETGLAASLRRAALVARRLPVRPLGGVLLVVAVGLTGGAATASVIGARRAQHAVPAFLRTFHVEDADAIAQADPAIGAKALAALGRLPGVDAVRRGSFIVVAVKPPGSARLAPVVANVDLDPPDRSGIERAHVLRGRPADVSRADEVVINEALADTLHLSVGDPIPVSFYRADQIDAVGSGLSPAAKGGSSRFRVVGVVRRPNDLERPGTARQGVDEFDGAYLSFTPAFWRQRGTGLASYGVLAYLRTSSPSSTINKEVAVAKLPVVVLPGNQVLKDATSVRRRTHIESASLWIVAALVMLVGIGLLGPALRRWTAVAPNEEALVALGVTRRGVLAVELLRAAPVVAVGAVLSVVVGAALAPLTGFGTSRLAELTHPVTWPTVVLAGAAGGVVAVGAVVMVTARLLGRHRAATNTGLGDLARGSQRIVGRLASAGAPPAAVAGARLALPGVGRDGTAIRSAVATAAFGIALLAGALTFSASMGHLVSTPALRGQNWDVEAGNYSDAKNVRTAEAFLAHDRDVAAFTGSNDALLRTGTQDLPILGLVDPAAIGLPVLSGRLPERAGEIALTSETIHRLHRHIGDQIVVEGDRSVRLRIVGTALGPGAVSDEQPLSRGGVVTFADMGRLEPNLVPGTFVVRFRSGVDRDAAVARLRRHFGESLRSPFDATEVTTLRQAQPLPILFAGLVAVLAAGTFVYGVASALHRRRKEVALLKALGFSRGQLRTASLCQSTLLALAAVVVGVPVGVVLGRWTWIAAARTVGVVVAPAVPVLTLGLIVVAVLALATVVGLGSSAVVISVPAAETLRPD